MEMVGKKMEEETPLVIFDDPEWKAWAQITVRGRITDEGKAIIADELLLSYRSMFINQ